MARRARKNAGRPGGHLLLRRRQQPIREDSAGGVVFKVAPTGIQVAFVKDPYGKWTFAKGHVEKGETMEQAAVRETQEEMGLRSLRVVAPLGLIELRFTDRYRPETKGREIHKLVHYFLLQAAPGAFGRPQRSEKIGGLVWVPLARAMERSSYGDAVPILDRALQILKRRSARLAASRIAGNGPKPAAR
jgi:8-oxo-dGTP pyrophosphatase MutT (NUDIX family)